MTTISATILPAGARVEPQPVLIGTDAESIQSIIGGYFDVVTVEVENDEGDTCVVIGYVHDEGLLLDLDHNYLATALFQRDLRGPCVLVSGTSPDGDYDGECYDLPSWVWEGISTDLVNRTAKTYNKAQLLQFGLRHAVSEMLCDRKELKDLIRLVVDPRDATAFTADQRELVDVIIAWATVEMYRARKLVESPEFADIVFDAMLDKEKEGE